MTANRELKKATESYWSGKISQESLVATGKTLRAAHWKLQKEAGADIIASNDFSFYDQVLDHIQLFNVSSRRRRDPTVNSWLICGSRLCPRGTAGMALTLWTSSSLWGVVCRGPLRILLPPSMLLRW